MNNRIHPHAKQQGIVLIVSLIMLVLLTLLSLSSMRVTSLEEKMTGNLHNNNLAFQASESALRSSENWLLLQTEEPAIDSLKVWAYNSMDSDTSDATPWWFEKSEQWWKDNAVEYEKSGTGVGNDFAIAPLSITEMKYKHQREGGLGLPTAYNPPFLYYYQVTTRGNGSTDQSRILVQSIVAKGY